MSGTDNENNPLLQPSTLPYEAPPFDKIKADHFLPAMEEALAEARQEIQAIKDNPAFPTFQNTIEALEFSGTKVGRVSKIFGNIVSANGTDALRDLQPVINRAYIAFAYDVLFDEELFQRVKAVYDMKDSMILSQEQRILLEDAYRDFVDNGALLNDQQKEELRQISKRLTEISTEFTNNIVKSTAAFSKIIENESDLAGVPARAKNNYRQAAEEKGLQDKWLIQLSPSPRDIFDYCENRALREEIYLAYTRVAQEDPYDNRPLILEMIKLRKRGAELFGYPNVAAQVLDKNMAKDAATVTEFLNKNLAGYKPAAEKHAQRIKDFAQKLEGVTELKPWDISYYTTKLLKAEYDFDPEVLRPYLNLEKVLQGLKEHAEKLFNINIEDVSGKYPVYHPDVKTFEVRDNKTGDIIGLLYGDYYARANEKEEGAWQSVVRGRGIENGENKFAIVTNVCNFEKPTATQPTMLSMRDVITVFHEFGHALHNLLAKGNYTSLTGTRVKRDFVEVPSQLQENWVRKLEVLNTFARHWQTGLPIPGEIFDKAKKLKNFGSASAGLGQTYYGLLDMKWQTVDPATVTSVEAVEAGVDAIAAIYPREPRAGLVSPAFDHIFAGGYAATYYGYKWAEVMEADIFEAFEKKGLYDQELAQLLREEIYAKGGTEDPMNLFVAVMKRKPDPKALFRREGIEVPPAPKAEDAAPEPPKKTANGGPSA